MCFTDSWYAFLRVWIVSQLLLYFLIVFLQYGPIAQIDLKIPPRPPGYAFVEVSSKLAAFILLSNYLFIFCEGDIIVFRFYLLLTSNFS